VLKINGEGNENAIRKAPRAGPINALPTSSTLHNRPLAVSSSLRGTIAGSMVCAALSRKTSAMPTSVATHKISQYNIGFDMPSFGGSAKGNASQMLTAAAKNAVARTASMRRISNLRSIRSVMIPAGIAKKNHGKRSATGTNEMSNGSRVKSVASQAHATVAIPSARLVNPLARTKRLNIFFGKESGLNL